MTSALYSLQKFTGVVMMAADGGWEAWEYETLYFDYHTREQVFGPEFEGDPYGAANDPAPGPGEPRGWLSRVPPGGD